MKVGDLVQDRIRPQGMWLVIKVSETGEWFQVEGFDRYNSTWLSANEFEVIN